MADDRLEATIGVNDDTAEGLDSAIKNISKATGEINKKLSSGFQKQTQEISNSVNSMSIMLARRVLKTVGNVVKELEGASSKVATAFYRFEGGAGLAETSMRDMAITGVMGMGELGKQMATVNQELGYMFGNKLGKEAQAVFSSIAVAGTKLANSTGVSFQTILHGYKAMMAGTGDVALSMDAVTQTVLKGNGDYLETLYKIGTEAPQNIGKATNAWIDHLGGVKAVQGATEKYVNDNITFTERLQGLWNSVLMTFQPLIDALNRVAGVIFPYIQAGLEGIRQILASLPQWVTDGLAFVAIFTMLGFVINMVTSVFARFGGLVGLVTMAFKTMGQVVLLPFKLIWWGVGVAGKALSFLGSIATAVGGAIAKIFTLAFWKIALIAVVAVGAGVALYNAFEPIKKVIDSLIAKLKTFLGLLGKKVKSGFGGGKKAFSGMPKMKAPTPPQIPQYKAPKMPKAKKPKSAKPKKDPSQKARDKALKAKKKEQDRLAKIEKDITKRLQDEFKRRKDAYMNFVGFFEGVNRKTIGISNLMKNFRSQEQALKDYSEAIHILQQRLGNSQVAQEFIAELEKLGPGAVDEIQALAFSSDSELQEVVGIFQRKSQLASDLASAEVAKLEPQIRKEIMSANQGADQDLTDGGKQWNDTMANAMGNMDTSILEGMDTMGGNMNQGWGNMGDISGGGMDSMTSLIGGKTTQLVGKMKGWWNSFTTWWSNYWKEHGVLGGILYGAGWIVGYLAGLWEQAKQAVKTKMNSMLNDAWQWCQDMFSKVARYWNTHSLAEIGADFVRGFWNGICSLGGWLHTKVSKFFDGVKEGVASAFKIHSPSRVMMEMGSYVSEGFGIGMEDGYKRYVDGLGEELFGGVDVDRELNDNVMFTQGATIYIDQMNVRNEKDIQAVGRALYKEEQRGMRPLGGGSRI